MEVSIWSFVTKKVRDLTVIEFKNLWNLGIIRLESQNLLVFVKADGKMHWSYEAKKGEIAMLPSAANLVKKKKKAQSYRRGKHTACYDNATFFLFLAWLWWYHINGCQGYLD